MLDWNIEDWKTLDLSEKDSELIQSILWDLKGQWPRRLERLLEKGRLMDHLLEVHDQVAMRRFDLYRQNVPQDVAEEIIRAEVMPPNPAYPDMEVEEMELNPKANKLMDQFDDLLWRDKEDYEEMEELITG